MSTDEKSDLNPEKIKSDLNTAITTAIKESVNYLPAKPIAERNRKLSKETMIKTLLGMDGGSLNKELRRLGLDVSASAFSQRRKVIDPRMYEEVFTNFNENRPITNTYRGYEIIAFDGSTIRIPTTDKDSDTFVYDGKDGYSALHLNAMYSVSNQEFVAATIQPQKKMNEPEALRYLLSWHNFKTPIILLTDRGLESFNLLTWGCKVKGLDVVIRVRNNGMKVIKDLPMKPLDTTVSCYISTRQDNLSKQLGAHFIQTGSKKGKTNSPKTKISSWDWESPYKLEFRVVRYQLEENGSYYTIATTLPKEHFSTEDIIYLYHLRWSEEIAFRTIKSTWNLLNLHGKSPSFAEQEIWCALTMHNFCSRIVSQIKFDKNDNQHPRMVNYKMASTICKEFFRDKNGTVGKDILKEIAKYTEVVRDGRSAPRNLRTKGVTPFVYRIAA